MVVEPEKGWARLLCPIGTLFRTSCFLPDALTLEGVLLQPALVLLSRIKTFITDTLAK
jgi:hypothetical protein